jgi:hypothetical protein
MPDFDPKSIALVVVAWIIREVWGYLRGTRAATVASRGAFIGKQLYGVAVALGWNADKARAELDDVVHHAAIRLGLGDQVDDLLKEAERELGQLMLQDSFAKLQAQVKASTPVISATIEEAKKLP